MFEFEPAVLPAFALGDEDSGRGSIFLIFKCAGLGNRVRTCIVADGLDAESAGSYLTGTLDQYEIYREALLGIVMSLLPVFRPASGRICDAGQYLCLHGRE